ncbi:MAG TPA: MOSC domain-containing protein [Bryobacteraceae bacterium]|nr:MOSC domain-containing protein [Bryobacteraceae bacterium]
MTGTVVQVNLSRGGVPKRPVTEAVLTPLGLEGDVQAHPEIHGGPPRAVLLIAAEVIDDLILRGYPIYYGALGENLTTRGIDRRLLRVGQRYRVGQALIELTKVRGPCSQLDVYGAPIKAEIYDDRVKSGDITAPRWAMSGFYAAVVGTGLIRANDIITLESELA